MRGEHRVHRHVTRPVKGSSPRARGAPQPHGHPAGRLGIIPACAGSTLCAAPPNSPNWDHPRVRGEHRARSPPCTSRVGSSPRARGALGSLGHHLVLVGIIPACAGSTSPTTTPRMSSRDHPRVRGEHQTAGRCRAVSRGSSPRARGAPVRGLPQQQGQWIIPACAGSTATRGTCPCTARDHPRVRGEHRATLCPDPGAGGSSPRARGALPARWEGVILGGIIPACAGSTPHP